MRCSTIVNDRDGATVLRHSNKAVSHTRLISFCAPSVADKIWRRLLR
jgi:uncharacterized protein (DUF302 family)